MQGGAASGPTGRYVLTGRAVRLRPVAPDDVELIHSWYVDADTARLAGERPRSLAARRRRLEEAVTEQGADPYAFMIVRLEDELPVGRIDLCEIDHVNGSASLGLTIATQDRRKGHGHDAIEILLRFGFEELRLERIWLDTDSERSAWRCSDRSGWSGHGCDSDASGPIEPRRPSVELHGPPPSPRQVESQTLPLAAR